MSSLKWVNHCCILINTERHLFFFVPDNHWGFCMTYTGQEWQSGRKRDSKFGQRREWRRKGDILQSLTIWASHFYRKTISNFDNKTSIVIIHSSTLKRKTKVLTGKKKNWCHKINSTFWPVSLCHIPYTIMWEHHLKKS